MDNYCANENCNSLFLCLERPKLPLRQNAFIRQRIHQAPSPEFEAWISSSVPGKGEHLLSHLVRNHQQKTPRCSFAVSYSSSGLTNRTAKAGIITRWAQVLGKVFLALGRHLFSNGIVCVHLCWATYWPLNDKKGRTSYVLAWCSLAVPCRVLFQRAFMSSGFCSLKTWCLLFLKTSRINYSS